MAIEEYKIQKVNPISPNKPRRPASEFQKGNNKKRNKHYCSPSDTLAIRFPTAEEYDNLSAMPKECDTQQHRLVALYREIYPYLEYND